MKAAKASYEMSLLIGAIIIRILYHYMAKLDLEKAGIRIFVLGRFCISWGGGGGGGGGGVVIDDYGSNRRPRP